MKEQLVKKAVVFIALLASLIICSTSFAGGAGSPYVRVGSIGHSDYYPMYEVFRQNRDFKVPFYVPSRSALPRTITVTDKKTGAFLCRKELAPSSGSGVTGLPTSWSCAANYSSLGNKEIKVENCYTGTNNCGFDTQKIKIVKDPQLNLDLTKWEKRKAEGLKYPNKMYNHSGKMVAAYYTEWSVYGRKFFPIDIPVENLTHIYHAFIPLCGENRGQDAINPNGNENLKKSCRDQRKKDFEVVIHDQSAAAKIYNEYYKMKKVFPHIKILPSIGGYSLSDPFYEMAKTGDSRRTFIKSIVDFLHTNEFYDGVDLDWEYPAVEGGATSGLASSADVRNFYYLVRDLKRELVREGRINNREYELHITLSGSASKLSPLKLGHMSRYVDKMNLMTYDYYGAWNNIYGLHNAIYDSTNASSGAGESTSAGLYEAEIVARAPGDILNVGIGAYGRGWDGITGGDAFGPFNGTSSGGKPSRGDDRFDAPASGRWEAGFADYKGLEANEMGGVGGTGTNGWNLITDPAQPYHQYLWNQASGSLMSLDTAVSAKQKAAISPGGVFMWSIDGDSGTLLNAMHEGLGHTPCTSYDTCAHP